jgi:hypothetical protein
LHTITKVRLDGNRSPMQKTPVFVWKSENG